MRFIILSVCFFLSFGAVAAEKAKQQQQQHQQQQRQTKKTSNLDFDADVIEGRRKAPDFFLQTENRQVKAGDMVYLRGDFNDFHAVDRGRRPHLSQ